MNNANSKATETVTMIGRKVRTPSGMIGTIERHELDSSKTRSWFHVRCGAKTFRLASKEITPA